MARTAEVGRPTVLSLETVAVLVGVIWGLVAIFWAVVVHWETSLATEARRREIERERPSSFVKQMWRILARGVVGGLPALFVIDGLWLEIPILYSPTLTLSTPIDLWLQIAGLAISGLGLAILILLGRKLVVRVYALASEERELMTTGAHRYVRHPFYVHFFVLPVGLFLLTLNVLALLMLIFYTELWEPKLLITDIREEEEELRRRFGAEYEEYAAHTPRFFPRFRRS